MMKCPLEDLTIEELSQVAIVTLVDGCRGIHAARSLIKQYGDRIKGIDDADKDAILAGPDHEDYFEASESIVNASIRMANGAYWVLDWYDGDIVAIDYHTIWDWEDATGQNFWDELT